MLMVDNRGIPESAIKRLNTPRQAMLRRQARAAAFRARRIAEARRRVAERETD